MALIEGVNFDWVASMASIVGLILFWAFLVLLFIAILGGGWYWFVYRKRLYNVDCIILVERQQGIVIGYDKGGFITKRKSSRFKLMKRKHSRVAPPDYKYLMLSELGRNTLFLYKYGEKDYCCLSPELGKEYLNLKPMEGTSVDSTVQDIRELIVDLDKPNKWEKWIMPIAVVLVALILMAGIYVSISILAKIISSNTSAYLEGAKIYERSMESLKAFTGSIS